MYSYVVLVEGNDARLIDVGLLSKYPIGGITSWKEARHPGEPNKNIFARDLLQVEILNMSRSKTLFTIFNTHLKSNYVHYTQDPVAGQAYNNALRSKQAESIATIIRDQTRPNSKYILTGDMNDAPASECLEGFSADDELNLTNALSVVVEDGEMNHTSFPPDNNLWTHRYRRGAGDYSYELYDQIWLSPSLSNKQTAAGINRREKVGGDGSDHDPAWIELNL